MVILWKILCEISIVTVTLNFSDKDLVGFITEHFSDFPTPNGANISHLGYDANSPIICTMWHVTDMSMCNVTCYRHAHVQCDMLQTWVCTMWHVTDMSMLSTMWHVTNDFMKFYGSLTWAFNMREYMLRFPSSNNSISLVMSPCRKGNVSVPDTRIRLRVSIWWQSNGWPLLLWEGIAVTAESCLWAVIHFLMHHDKRPFTALPAIINIALFRQAEIKQTTWQA